MTGSIGSIDSTWGYSWMNLQVGHFVQHHSLWMVQTVEGFQRSEVIFLCSRRRPTYECWISSSKSLDGSICCNNVTYRATALLYWIFFSNKFSVYFWKRLHALINAICWQIKKGINIFGHSQVELLLDGFPIMNMKWHAQFRHCSARWIIF